MEKLYAIQWLNPDNNLWEVCQTFDHKEHTVPCILFNEDSAKEELEDWKTSDTSSTYRLAEVEIKEK